MKDEPEKLLIVPVALLVIALIIGLIFYGLDFVLQNWTIFLIAFVSLEAFFAVIIFLVTSRLNNLFNSGKSPFVISIGLFLNLYFFLYRDPSYFFKLWQVIVPGVISWILFPIIFSKRFENSETNDMIPNDIKVLLFALVYFSIIGSVMFFAVVDFFYLSENFLGISDNL